MDENQKPTQKTQLETDCLVPPPAQPEALEKYLLRRGLFDGADEIKQYVEGQSPSETES